MTNTCYHHEHENKKMRVIVWALLGIIVAFAFVVFLVWAILHPHRPRFVLQDLTISNFNFSPSNLLTSKLQVTLSSHNPNDNIGIFYDHLDIYSSYRNLEVTSPIQLPVSYQGHKEDTVWSPFLNGSAVLSSYNKSPLLTEDLAAGIVPLNIKIDGSVRWKVGSWVSGSYHLQVNCQAFLPFTGASAGPVIKNQKCVVDV